LSEKVFAARETERPGRAAVLPIVAIMAAYALASGAKTPSFSSMGQIRSFTAALYRK
jgi:hypothetical protein